MWCACLGALAHALAVPAPISRRGALGGLGAEVIGPDHTGIGTDMDGISPPSFATFDDYARWPSIPEALLARGFSQADVAKVMGGNFIRVFTEVTRS